MTLHSRFPSVILAGLGVWLACSATASAFPAYVRSNVAAPWGSTSNEEAMDLAFGLNAWDDLRFEDVDPQVLFADGYHIIYLEGSDSNADELGVFLAANQDLVETWVGSGGTLFLNSAPNEGGAQNWGFGGVTMNYPEGAAGSGTAANPEHPIWQGPFLPCATDFTGSSYAHSSVTVPGGQTLILSTDNFDTVNLSEMPFGSGTVIFGGLTTSNFWEPQPDALNLRANILNYLAAGAMQGPCHDGDIDKGEACDDGNFINTDDCVGSCVLPSCGDGYVQAGVEPCDDGNESTDDACLPGCIAATCGDGFIEAEVEACDDQDADNTDSCIDTCQLASCGDGHVFAGFEECDDMNMNAGDGCTACQLDSSESSSEGGEESSSEGGTTDVAESTGNVEESTGASSVDDTTGGESSGGGDDTSSGGGGSSTATDPTGPMTSATEADTAEGSSESTGNEAETPGGCSCNTTDDRGRGLGLGALLLGFGLRRRRR